MKRIAVVSDLQCGSIFGMLPPDFVTSEGVIKPQNDGQKYLWGCWLQHCDKVKTFAPDYIIVNGDCIDGPQRKQQGSELSLTLLFDQRRAAVETLRVLKNAAPKAKWYFTQGTEYHVGTSAEHEEEIAKELGAKL
jgi:hypothetical protein